MPSTPELLGAGSRAQLDSDLLGADFRRHAHFAFLFRDGLLALPGGDAAERWELKRSLLQNSSVAEDFFSRREAKAEGAGCRFRDDAVTTPTS